MVDFVEKHFNKFAIVVVAIVLGYFGIQFFFVKEISKIEKINTRYLPITEFETNGIGEFISDGVDLSVDFHPDRTFRCKVPLAKVKSKENPFNVLDIPRAPFFTYEDNWFVRKDLLNSVSREEVVSHLKSCIETFEEITYKEYDNEKGNLASWGLTKEQWHKTSERN